MGQPRPLLLFLAAIRYVQFGQIVFKSSKARVSLWTITYLEKVGIFGSTELWNNYVYVKVKLRRFTYYGPVRDGYRYIKILVLA